MNPTIPESDQGGDVEEEQAVGQSMRISSFPNSHLCPRGPRMGFITS